MPNLVDTNISKSKEPDNTLLQLSKYNLNAEKSTVLKRASSTQILAPNQLEELSLSLNY